MAGSEIRVQKRRMGQHQLWRLRLVAQQSMILPPEARARTSMELPKYSTSPAPLSERKHLHWSSRRTVRAPSRVRQLHHSISRLTRSPRILPYSARSRQSQLHTGFPASAHDLALFGRLRTAAQRAPTRCARALRLPNTITLSLNGYVVLIGSDIDDGC